MDDLPAHLLRCGDLEVNALSHSLTFAGRPLDVDPQHVKVLWLLLVNPDKFLSIDQLLSGGWRTQNTNVNRDSVYQAISRLRVVLTAVDPGHHTLWITSRRNSGYKAECAQPIFFVHDSSLPAVRNALPASTEKARKGSEPDTPEEMQTPEFAQVLASPHHMPCPPLDFTGRREDLQRLTSEEAAGVRLMGLRGDFGVGKTALGLKIAEVLSSKYPDAHCYLDLKGLSKHPLSAADAMRHVIWSFLPDARLPQKDEELGMLYRSFLYKKRVLLLFDNVRDATHIKLFVPPSSCLLIVASRHHFAFPGMLEHEVARLSPEEAEKFLLTITPRIKPQVEPIASLCGYLPLALRAAGSAIAEHIDLDPASYAASLVSARARLALTDPTENLSIESSIQLSYDLLTEELRQRFRTLSVFPGTFDAYAAAAVWKLGMLEARDTLSSLVRNALVAFNPADKRYSLLDFPHIYSDFIVSDKEQYRGALNHASHFHRVLAIAEGLYLDGRESTKIGLELFRAEMPNIKGGQAWCAKNSGDDPTAAALCSSYPETGFYVLEFSHHPEERIAWSWAALRAARSISDIRMEGRHLGSLGIAYWRLGDARRAADFFRQALNVTKRSKDPEGQARAFRGLGLAYQTLGWRHRSLRCHRRALDIDRALHDKRNEGRDLNNLGIAYAAVGETVYAIKCHRRHLIIARTAGDIRAESAAIGNLAAVYRELGNTRRAIALQKRALAIDSQSGDMVGEAGDLLELGLTYIDLGRNTEAIDCFERALRLTRITGDRLREADVLFALCQARYELGNVQTAVARAREALNLYEQLAQPRAKTVRAIMQRWLQAH